MCGIYAVLGPGIIHQDLKVFEELGMVSMLRGTDGAGLFNIPSKHATREKVKTVKSSQDFLAFMIQLENVSEKDKDGNKKPVVRDKRYFLNQSDQGIVGHNRAATIGGISSEGSHPFYSKNMKIIGCHNGTITARTEYGKSILDRVDNKNYHTDSQVLIDDIGTYGPEVLSKLDDQYDAYSLVWMDLETRGVFFVKNSKRPMIIGVHKTRSVIYLCSEKPLMEAVIDRNNVDVQYWIPNDRHVMRFDCSYGGNIQKSRNGEIDWNSFKLPKPDFKKLPVVSSNTNSKTSDVHDDYSDLWEGYAQGVSNLPTVWTPNTQQNLH